MFAGPVILSLLVKSLPAVTSPLTNAGIQNNS